MLSARHKQALKALSRSNAWEALLALQQELQEVWQREIGTGQTEFEYLRNCLTRDGKIEGINAFLTNIELFNNESYAPTSRTKNLGRTTGRAAEDADWPSRA